MEQKLKSSVPTQGVDADKKFNKEEVVKMLSHDIGIALSLLNAIKSDPNLLDHVADYMMGQFENAQNAKLQLERMQNQKAS